jgi:3-phosphoshikimate 1-carboxyvinyltransferase
MRLIIQNTQTLAGDVTPPSSKSHSIRALFFALLAEGTSTLRNVLASDDIENAIAVCKQLGAHIVSQKDQLTIESKGLPLVVDVTKIVSGNSGITTRFMLPLLGLRQNTQTPITTDCGEQMRARPIQSLVDALRKLGLHITYLAKENQLPLSISGALIGGEAGVEGITSQYLSALLMALPCAPHDSILTVNHLHERPYVEMTLRWLSQQQLIFKHSQLPNQDKYFIKGNQHYRPIDTTIPGDFSSASYLIAAAALTAGRVELNGLDMQDAQGDKRLVNILQDMGADISVFPTHLVISGGKPLKGCKIDANDIPDLLPTLAVIGTAAQGCTTLYNVKQARIKETDRIHSMTENLRRLGARIEEHEDGMTIYQSQLSGSWLKGYDDHRTVMALGIAGLLATDSTVIEGSEAINKTFPQFTALMQSLGANIHQVA